MRSAEDCSQRLIKEITIASRIGGGDMEANARLRTAVLKAKEANMPKDNIDRAIKKGTGDLEGSNYIEFTYEGYGPGGVAILINILTDNKNRTAADMRNILGKSGGNLGESGCVSYLFKRKGIITLDAEKYQEDQVLEAALEAGAEDVSTQDESIEVVTEPEDFEAVLEALTKAGYEHETAEVTKVADASVTLDVDTTHKALRLIDRLDDHDDVQSVSSNLDIPDDFEFPEE